MNGYAFALFVHLLSVLVATAASAVALVAALRLRHADSVGDAMPWLGLVRRVVPLFPFAVVGLLVTGGYMTHQRWGWSIPWVMAAVAGLALIVALGSGVEGSRNRLLMRELETSGMSPRARRLLRDPLAWSAKMTTLTVLVAVVFVMTVKPGGMVCVSALCLAVVAGPLTALPMWRVPGGRAAELAGSAAP